MTGAARRPRVQLTVIVLVLLVWLAGLGACAPVYQPAGPLKTTPAMLSHAFLMADGYRLPFRHWRPSAPERAVILAVHGFNDYGYSFHGTAGRFAAAGLHTYAYDQRGFGYTENRGVWPGTDTLVQDLALVMRLLKRRHPHLPIILIGESMGAAVVLTALGGPAGHKDLESRVTGAVLSAPAVWGRAFMNGVYQASLDLTFALAPTFPVRPPASLKIRASDNLEALIDLGTDPLVLKATRVDAIHGVVDLMDAAQTAATHVAVPTLVLYGERDQIIPRAPVDRLAQALPAERTEYRLYADGYHLLLRDLDGEEVAQDTIAWIDRVLRDRGRDCVRRC